MYTLLASKIFVSDNLLGCKVRVVKVILYAENYKPRTLLELLGCSKAGREPNIFHSFFQES